MKQLSHYAVILPVENVDSSMGFYAEKLGFEIFYKHGEPVII